MRYTEREVLQFVEENDVKFVKLMFCDVFGNLKAISVLSSELTKIFRSGYAFDASAMDGFMGVYKSDLVLKPVLDTLSLLPWRPQQGRVMRLFCEIYTEDGSTFDGDGRHFLAQAVEKAKKLGLDFRIGTSCEFYVFKLDEKGIPTKIPHDVAGTCDVAPMDRGENLRRDICMTLEQMEIYPESSRHESGPGQNEIDFIMAPPLEAADNLVTFKNTVKSVSSRNGLYASFMPKPMSDKCGSSLQITVTCTKNGDDVFAQRGGCITRIGDRMIGGLLKNLPSMTLFLNGVTNSYTRLRAIGEMKNSSWTQYNINVPVRLRRSAGGNRVVVCTPDNTCNPYFALGLIINACLDGIASNCAAGEPVTDINSENTPVYGFIPESLEGAVSAARASEFISASLPMAMLHYVLEKKTGMCEEFAAAHDREEYETAKYFYTL